MNKTVYVIPTFLILSICLSFCFTGNLFAQEQKEVPVITESFPVSGAVSEVLILSRGTEFKKIIRTALIEKLNEKQISVVVDKMDNADSYDPADFDAVVLLSGIQGFSPLPEAIDFIREHKYAGNIIYVSTYTLFAAPYGRTLDKKRVDAITAASKHKEGKKFEKAFQSILNNVFALVN